MTGREAFERRAWREAYEQLAGADELVAEDIERLAVAAHLAGHDDECVVAWERAHAEHVRRGDELAAGTVRVLGRAHPDAARAHRRGRRLVRPVERDGGLDRRRVLDLRLPARPDVPRASRARATPSRLVPSPTASSRSQHAARDQDLLALGLLCQGEAAVALGELAAACGASTTPWCRSRPARSRPCPPESSTAGSSRPAWTPSTCSEPRSGPRHSTSWCAGQPEPRALPGPVPGPPVTGPPGPRRVAGRRGRRRGRATATSPTPSTRRSAPRCTSSATCTGSAGSMQPPSAPIARRAGTGESRHPASRCCGSRRETSPRPSRRSNGSSRRPAASAAMQRCWRRRSRSCSRRAKRSPHGASPMSSGSSSTVRRRSTSRRSGRTRSGTVAARRGRRGGGHRGAAARGRGLAPARHALRRRTRRRGDRPSLPGARRRRRRRLGARRRTGDLRAPRRAHRPRPGGPARRCDAGVGRTRSPLGSATC